MDRIKQSARDYKEAERVLKSELIKRFKNEIDENINKHRDRCMLECDAKLHRNQGKWEILEKTIKPLLLKITAELKQEAGSTDSVRQ